AREPCPRRGDRVRSIRVAGQSRWSPSDCRGATAAGLRWWVCIRTLVILHVRVPVRGEPTRAEGGDVHRLPDCENAFPACCPSRDAVRLRAGFGRAGGRGLDCREQSTSI